MQWPMRGYAASAGKRREASMDMIRISYAYEELYPKGRAFESIGVP